jgi:hypothetical protein
MPSRKGRRRRRPSLPPQALLTIEKCYAAAYPALTCCSASEVFAKVGLFDILRSWPKSDAPIQPYEKDAFVPDGCRLELYRSPPPIAAVNRIVGGALIASQGVTNDEPEAEIDRLFSLLDDELKKAWPNVIFLKCGASLSEVFSTALPTRTTGAIIWVLNPNTFLAFREGPGLLQRLLYKMYLLRTRQALPLTQIIYVTDAETPAGVCLSNTLSDLGLTVHKPARSDEGLVAAAQRADGSIVTGLLGEPVAPSDKAEEYFQAVCDQKYRVQVAGDAVALSRIEGEERDYLATRLGCVNGKVSKTVQWAPQLHRFVSQAVDGSDASRRALLSELTRREPHLIFLVNPDARSVTFRSWPGVDRGLELFPDCISARLAHCIDDPEKTATFGDLAPRELFAWLATMGAGAGMGVKSADEDPRWVMLYPNEMQPLSEGRLPPSLVA